MKKIVFVCTGNTCRSPMADGIFRVLLGERGMTGIESASAGLSAVADTPVTNHAVAAAAEYGADISGHRASPVTHALLDGADLFVCMTDAHARALLEHLPPEKVTVLGDGIADPYGAEPEEYRACALSVRDGLLSLIEKILPEEG